MNKYFDINNNYFEAKVELNINLKNGSIGKYILLPDSDGRIHDYKVIWKKLIIQTSTTPSHKEKKANNFAMNFRIKLLNELNIEHEFSKKKKKIELTQNQVKIVNNLFDSKWKNQTFQNIIYVVYGSNASGEATKPSNGNLYTQLDDRKFYLSIFLQSLLINKKFPYREFNYESIWKKDIHTIPAQEWIKNNYKLSLFLEEFNNLNNKNDWKKTKEHFINTISNYQNEQFTIDKLVAKKRSEFFKKCEKLNKTFLFIVFRIKNNYKLEYAHIKPVSLIKKEMAKDPKVIEQISDVNNCYPLTPNLHKYYDSFQIMWNIDGELLTNNNLKYNLGTELNEFKKINKYALDNSKKYMLDYIQWVNKNKKIIWNKY